MLQLVDPYSPDVERKWQAFAPRSYFLSWGWIENWLACLPRDRAPRLALWHDGSAAFFLGSRLALRHRVFPARSLYLNATGVTRLDELWIEYNGVTGRELALDELIAALPRRWDELVLPGLSADAFGGLVERDQRDYRVCIDRHVPACYVDLARVRERDYPSLLSGQTRSQLRRAQKLAGDTVVEVAGEPRHAIAIYDELVALHGAQWRVRGQPGAFADPWFDRFHRRLIARRFEAGEIQLVRVRDRDHTIGCLYNFVFRGRVLQYQSGFARYDDAKMKPGYVCHAAAIAHSAGAGLAIYDLLAGDVRYKHSLSTDAGALIWARVVRPRLRWFEDRIVNAVRRRRASASARS